MKRDNIERCRNLRKNQTEAETKLCLILRDRQLTGVKFRRQFSVGKYILDFYSPEYRLGIECDGGQHYKENGKQRDELRERELSSEGIEILRFSNLEILSNLEGVYKIIQDTIEKKKDNFPSPQSSPQRGEEVKKKEV
jgi:very-short-patch-repair endonuclease